MVRFKICDTDTKFLEQLAHMLHEIYTPCTVEYMYGPDVLEVSLRSSNGDADVLLTELPCKTPVPSAVRKGTGGEERA